MFDSSGSLLTIRKQLLSGGVCFDSPQSVSFPQMRGFSVYAPPHLPPRQEIDLDFNLLSITLWQVTKEHFKMAHGVEITTFEQHLADIGWRNIVRVHLGMYDAVPFRCCS